MIRKVEKLKREYVKGDLKIISKRVKLQHGIFYSSQFIHTRK